jgi:hypothetical protein
MDELANLIDPPGAAAAELCPRKLRSVVQATKILTFFDKLTIAQMKFDDAEDAAGEFFDEEKALAEMEEAKRQRLEERKREDEEIRRRKEARQQP